MNNFPVLNRAKAPAIELIDGPLRLFLLSIFPLMLGASQSPPVPPAGVVDRQIEQEYEAKEVQPQKEVPLLEFDLPAEELDIGGEQITIYGVDLSGNTVVHSRILKRILKPYLGKPLTMKELRDMCRLIQNKYARKGYFLTQAYLPPQEVREGVLKIEVVEGRLGQVTVIGNRYYSASFIARYFEKYQGKPVQYDKILRTLFLLDDNSDLEVGAVFKKGSEFATADLIVRAADKRPIHLTLDTNNYGSDHTTHERTGTRLDYGNLIMDGDQLTVIEVLGAPVTRLNFTDVIYHLPIGSNGLGMDVSYLCANFKTKRVDHIRYLGRSHIGEIKFNQALHRTRRLSTDLFVSFDIKQVQNYGGGKRTSFDKLRVLTEGIEIDYIDGWKGRNVFNVSASQGIPGILGGASTRSSDDSRVGGGGRFTFVNGSWKRLQELPYNCFLLFNSALQLSFNQLPLPEQIYIGGIDTVRGYALAEGLGDHGFYATLELHAPLPFLRAHHLPWSGKKTWGEFLQFVGFIDHGQTFAIGDMTLRELEIGSDKTHFDSRAILTAAGPGIRLHGPWKLEWSFDVGFPLTQRHRSSNTITYFRVAWKIL